VRTLIDDILLNPLVLLSIGLTITIVAAFALADVPATMSRLDHVEQLQPVAAAAPGQAAFVEGHVSDLSPVVYREFVAYLYEEYQSNGDTSHWVEVARHTPPLVIESQGRVIRIVNRDYEVEATDVKVLEEPPTYTKGAVQSRGFAVSSPVLAVGTAAQEPGELMAEFVYAGTRAGYIDHLRRYIHNAKWWGGGLLFGGIGCMFLGVWRIRRFLREANSIEKAVGADQIGRFSSIKSRSHV
jgi:hypothetical protein